ncbi:MAG: hypothetical protein PVI23_02055 [Maricaulaceae bacterium]|jgi:hypothetical protein
MTTFSDLGIPFPLYQAPIDTCPSYAGAQRCCVLGERRDHCFRLGSGDYLTMECAACGGALYLHPTESPLRVRTCRHCGAPTPDPAAAHDDAFISYEALRAGYAVFTKDTDYGMVSWQELEEGWSHGVPRPAPEGLRSRQSAGGWTQTQLPTDALFELTSTPDFLTCQGAVWLFSGARPMIYVGEWRKADFVAHAPNGRDAKEFFLNVVRDADDETWSYADSVFVYVFKDQVTDAYAAYYDLD